MAEFYGIDLGTTYSCIARIDSDSIPQIVSIRGNQYTPSAIAFDDNNKMIVGQAAKNNITNNRKNTVILIKREMSNKDYTRTINGKTYTPVDISSFILKDLVDEANKQLAAEEDGFQPIYDVVITVPAYFGTLEKERTLAAGKKAGLNVLQLINEPTAAALAYGRKQRADKTLLVYDLGGGTFDVSILRFENWIINTLSTDGDHHLGGADWDRAIVDFALKKINANYDSLSPEEQGMVMLAAEKAKITLTDADSTTISFVYNGIKNVDITRNEFESITRVLLDNTMELVDAALERANKTASDIDEIILVGGSSYMPMVKQAVDKKFGKQSKLTQPNLAVALGAALTAINNHGDGQTKGPVIGSDKGSRAYGTDCKDVNGNYIIQTLINRNDDLEIEREVYFRTLTDGQTSVGFRFFEYESDEELLEMNEDWELKGKQSYIKWDNPAPKGTPIRTVTKRDRNGIVKVFAECNGSKGEFIIVNPGVN